MLGGWDGYVPWSSFVFSCTCDSRAFRTGVSVPQRPAHKEIFPSLMSCGPSLTWCRTWVTSREQGPSQGTRETFRCSNPASLPLLPGLTPVSGTASSPSRPFLNKHDVFPNERQCPQGATWTELNCQGPRARQPGHVYKQTRRFSDSAAAPSTFTPLSKL